MKKWLMWAIAAIALTAWAVGIAVKNSMDEAKEKTEKAAKKVSAAAKKTVKTAKSAVKKAASSSAVKKTVAKK